MILRAWLIGLLALGSGCAPTPAAPATSVLLITIDTLRADHVGAYGATAARTPTLDALAREGARFDRAWAPAPLTLPSHASLLSGRYPPGHGARHNGIAMQAVPTLATAFKAAGFSTAAFVSAFPLDRRFGLTRGFDEYEDQLPRSSEGRPLNERPATETVDRALAWLRARGDERFFVWVHLFEPHAPYGEPGTGGSVQARYDADIAVADREAGRLVAALGAGSATTLVVAASDHGEAFGEHGEIGHSIFVYDTTLRVPLVMRGPGVRAATVVTDDVSLVDVAPTLLALTGTAALTGDGQSLVPALRGEGLSTRAIYAESFAPLFDFGWAGLRSVREGSWKYIAAPRAELFDLASDPGESANRLADEPERTARLEAETARWSPAEPAATAPVAPEALARLQSLGYLSGTSRPAAARTRPDPKDRIAVASRLATVTSGEVRGDELVETLEAVLREDPPNPQAHLRLGFAELELGRCPRAEPHLRAALDAGMPSADAGLGLAACLGQSGNLTGAREALNAARRAEPGNPVVAANLGLLELEEGQLTAAIAELRTALSVEPRLLEARFALARALARAGDREGAVREATTLLGQLAPDAPQRAEAQRLLRALQ
jgi:choline-sulfatase